MEKWVIWDEYCKSCGVQLHGDEIYSGLCVYCQQSKEQIKPLNKVELKKADVGEAIKKLNKAIELLPDLTMNDFIQKSVERNDFEWFKANKGFVIKHIEDLRKENQQLKEEVEKHRYWHIEHFKGEKEWKHKALYDVPRETRKRVCEEIREKAKYDYCFYTISPETLEQIEKGGANE